MAAPRCVKAEAKLVLSEIRELAKKEEKVVVDWSGVVALDAPANARLRVKAVNRRGPLFLIRCNAMWKEAPNLFDRDGVEIVVAHIHGAEETANVFFAEPVDLAAIINEQTHDLDELFRLATFGVGVVEPVTREGVTVRAAPAFCMGRV